MEIDEMFWEMSKSMNHSLNYNVFDINRYTMNNKSTYCFKIMDRIRTINRFQSCMKR